MTLFCLAVSKLVIGIGLVFAFFVIMGVIGFLRGRREAFPNGSGKTSPNMKALVGPKSETSSPCLSNCIRCNKHIRFSLPHRPIRGQRPQLVNKYKCNHCGQILYATTCTTGMAVLAVHCSIVDGQMRFENPMELQIEEAGQGILDNSKVCPLLPITVLQVGRGRDGKTTLLSPEDFGCTINYIQRDEA